jgi:hypothetical protein
MTSLMPIRPGKSSAGIRPAGRSSSCSGYRSRKVWGWKESQLQTAERLLKLAAAALKAACIDMRLVRERDGVHGLPATTVFTKAEIKTLEALNPTPEGKTEKQQNPHPAGSLARTAWVIARPGSWHCYGKPPGPVTFHRGMERFNCQSSACWYQARASPLRCPR